MAIELIRFLDHSRKLSGIAPMGCFGELIIDGEFVCYTVEQPWRNNRRFVSCVPTGEYFLLPFSSDKYGDVVALTNGSNVVAYEHEAKDGDRYACLFHAANWSKQLQGCIAPGELITWAQGNLMVTRSKQTLAKILPKLKGQSITIRWKHEESKRYRVGIA